MKNGALGILLDCMPAACMLLSVSVLAASAWQVSAALDASREVFDAQESVIASIVAEDAAFEAAHRSVELRREKVIDVESLVGIPARVSLNGERLQVEVESGDAGFAYVCDLLPGAAPRCLGTALALRRDVVEARPALRAWVTACGFDDAYCEELSETKRVSDLLDARLVDATGAGAASLVREDRSIGLLRLKAGTDRKDFAFAHGNDRVWQPKLPESGICVVAGNLWVDRGDEPLIIELRRPLTVVVDGNIYLGRSVVVRGPGRLIFVARRGATPTFLDSDMSGGWSIGDQRIGGDPTTKGYSGPVEGAGSIFLGLPSRNRDARSAAEPQTRLDVVAGLVTDNEVYVVSKGLTTVHGAMVLQAGISWAKGAALANSAKILPNIERERVPGFRRTGAVRPGMLTPVE